MAYGTPERMDDVRPYLTHIRHGHEPSDNAVRGLQARYELIGGPSPLYQTTVEQMKALLQRLNAGGILYRGYLGMKHWHPYIPDAVACMAEEGIEAATAITLAPHYSTMSIAQYLNYIKEGLARIDEPPRILCVKSYHDEPKLIDAFEEKLWETMMALPGEHRNAPVIFTAHSLPEKILQADDPYREQLLTTCRLLAERFEDMNWRFAFTSQGETKDRWLGPTLAESLDEVATEGHKAVIACTVGFVSEHLETLYDFDIKGRRDAEERGLAFYRAPALNTSPTFISALAEVVRKAEAGQRAETVWLPGEEIESPTYPTYT